MKRSYGNSSLLALLTTAIAACGESSDVLPTSDGGHDDSSVVSDTSGGGMPGDEGGPTADQRTGDEARGEDTGDGAQDGTGDGAMSDAIAVDGTGGGASDARSSLDSSADASCPPGSMPAPDGGCLPLSVRRPFLVGSSMRSAAPAARRDWSRSVPRPASEPDAVTGEALAQSWLRDALEEHASVAAFARFTMLLLSAGAPPDLVVGSQRASLDEIHHAQACFALAQRYGRRAYGPALLPVHDALVPMSLAEMAALTAEEGCVGETLGAALAAEQLRVATDPEVRAILRKIAADEARHAQLAWRFAKWAADTGGQEVRHAIAQAAERAIAATLSTEIRTYEGIDLAVWHTHGRLTCVEARSAATDTLQQVVRPCLALVVSGGARAEARARTTLLRAFVWTQS
jgi:hypothetical protein